MIVGLVHEMLRLVPFAINFEIHCKLIRNYDSLLICSAIFRVEEV